jgi:hypothetical protein
MSVDPGAFIWRYSLRTRLRVLLGTLSRYTDNTMSVSLGTAQVSYSLLTSVDTGSPIGIVVTKIVSTQNTLIETDVTNYTMTSSNVVSLAGASALS